MGHAMEFHNDQDNKQHENKHHVHYEACGKKQKFIKEDHCKEKEKICHTKYAAGERRRGARRTSSHHLHSKSAKSSAAAGRPTDTPMTTSMSTKSHSATPLSARQSQDGGRRRSHKSSSTTAAAGSSSKKAKSTPSLAQRVSRCYEIKRIARRGECSRKPVWQRGKYVRDECGSGIVPKRFDFLPCHQLWCKTPLSVYQATVGELARKLLCGKIRVPRDVKPEPPSNIAEYIFPPCRGYYRKYDCLRPCEEEYAVVKGGQRVYRDRVQRYWEPCLTKAQKHKLDVNEYAPQNAFLAIKMRRQNEMGDLTCW